MIILLSVDVMWAHSLLLEGYLVRRQLLLVCLSNILNNGILVVFEEFIILKNCDLLNFLDPLNVVVGIQKSFNLILAIYGQLLLMDSVHRHPREKVLGHGTTRLRFIS